MKGNFVQKNMISSTHLHAMVVHFPIALLIFSFLSEIFSFFYNKTFFRQAALYLLIPGTLGTISAYLAGKADGEGMDEGSLGKAIELHEQAATLALWLTIATAAIYLAVFIFKFNKTPVRIAAIILFTAVIGAIARTGYLGGELVYKHGAGVKLELPDFSNPGNDKE